MNPLKPVGTLLRKLHILPDGDTEQESAQEVIDRQEDNSIEDAQSARRVLEEIRTSGRPLPTFEEFRAEVEAKREEEQRIARIRQGRHDLYARGRNGHANDH